jgi:hypothetical protein
MKKAYIIPSLQQSAVGMNYQICDVSGHDGGGSGTGEGEEEMGKRRKSEFEDDSWGSLW